MDIASADTATERKDRLGSKVRSVWLIASPYRRFFSLHIIRSMENIHFSPTLIRAKDGARFEMAVNPGRSNSLQSSPTEMVFTPSDANERGRLPLGKIRILASEDEVVTLSRATIEVESEGVLGVTFASMADAWREGHSEMVATVRRRKASVGGAPAKVSLLRLINDE